jgi:rhamnosyltransferase
VNLFCLVPVFDAPADLADRLASIDVPLDHVVVVDDGSALPYASDRFPVLRHTANRGIAAALNTGLRWCAQRGATHVMTLDQDTELPPGYANRMVQHWADAEQQGLRPAVLAAGNFADGRYTRQDIVGLTALDEVLQSGSVFDLTSLLEIGGFDESLVIDAVDADVCLRFTAAGRGVVATGERIIHAPGRTRHFRILGWEIASTNHPPFRRYYIVRNRLRILSRYGHSHPAWALRTTRRLVVGTLLAVTVEQRRWDNLRATGAGLVDFLRRRSGLLAEDRRRRWA